MLQVKSDGEDNPPDADETAKGAHDDDSAVEAVLFGLKVEHSSTYRCTVVYCFILGVMSKRFGLNLNLLALRE